MLLQLYETQAVALYAASHVNYFPHLVTCRCRHRQSRGLCRTGFIAEKKTIKGKKGSVVKAFLFTATINQLVHPKREIFNKPHAARRASKQAACSQREVQGEGAGRAAEARGAVVKSTVVASGAVEKAATALAEVALRVGSGGHGGGG